MCQSVQHTHTYTIYLWRQGHFELPRAEVRDRGIIGTGGAEGHAALRLGGEPVERHSEGDGRPELGLPLPAVEFLTVRVARPRDGAAGGVGVSQVLGLVWGKEGEWGCYGSGCG
jgi:hypothetical protein